LKAAISPGEGDTPAPDTLSRKIFSREARTVHGVAAAGNFAPLRAEKDGALRSGLVWPPVDIANINVAEIEIVHARLRAAV